MKYCELNYCYLEEQKEDTKAETEEAGMPDAEEEGESYRRCRNFVFAKLINTQSHLEMLERMPNESVLDLSLVAYMFEDMDPDKEEVPVTNDMLKAWRIEKEELFRDAMGNTRALMGEMIKPLRELIRDMIGKMHIEMEEEEDENIMPMYVLTNLWKRNGALCMLYNDTLAELADMLESDLYVIPSSIHEVILVPVSGCVRRGDLDSMVQQINRTELLSEDVLSDHTYLFLRSLRKVII